MTTSTNGLTDSIGGPLYSNKTGSSKDNTSDSNETPVPSGQWSFTFNAEQPDQILMSISIDLKSLGVVQLPLPTDSTCSISYSDSINATGVNSLLSWLSQVKSSMADANKEKSTKDKKLF